MDLELHQLNLRYAALRLRRRAHDRRLLADLAENGQQVPVVVVSDEQEQLVLIDGYRRVGALRRLGCDIVTATQWPLCELEALLLHRCQRTQEQESALEQGWFLCELKRRFSLSLLELSVRLGRTKSWVSRRLALVEQLPSCVQTLVREGKICPHAAGKSLVPLARANPSDCEHLAQAIAALKLTSREVATLWQGWQASSRRQRQKLIQDPQLYLQAQRSLETSAEPACPVRTLVVDLERLAALARRVERRLEELRIELDEREHCQIERSFAQAREDFEALAQRLQPLLEAASC